MSRVVFRALALSGALVVVAGAGVAIAQAPAAGAPSGQTVFETRCKFCHDPAAFGAPGRDTLVTFEHAKVVEALTVGKMMDNAAGLTPAEISAVATYVTGKSPAGGAPPSATPAPATPTPAPQ